jgi:hypothetical protein
MNAPVKNLAILEPLRKHMDSANKRFLNAIRMLATVKKLLRPALSPLAIATRLGPQGSRFTEARPEGLVRRTGSCEEGMLVGVEN